MCKCFLSTPLQCETIFRNQRWKSNSQCGFCKEPCLPMHEYGLCRPNEADETGTLPTDCRLAHGWNVVSVYVPVPYANTFGLGIKHDTVLCPFVNRMKIKLKRETLPIFHFPRSAYYNGTHNDGS